MPTTKPELAAVDPNTAADIKGGATKATGSTPDIDTGKKVAVDL